MEMEAGGGESSNANKQRKHKGKHDKPKPWDDDPNIDRWKVEKFDPSWNEGGLLEVSSFSTLFPQYRGFLRQSFLYLCSCNLHSYYWRKCSLVCNRHLFDANFVFHCIDLLQLTNFVIFNLTTETSFSDKVS